MSKQDYIGVTGKTHDSKSEASASFYYAKFGCAPCSDYLPWDIRDSTGRATPSRPDFWQAACGLYIEDKSAPLNSVTTKTISEKRLQERADWRRGEPWLCDRLKFGWNHSRYAKAAIQKASTPLDYVVSFKDAPTDAEMSAYLSKGLWTIPRDALPSYLLYVRLAKAGLAVSFQLNYSDDEAGHTAVTLGDYYGDAETVIPYAVPAKAKRAWTTV